MDGKCSASCTNIHAALVIALKRKTEFCQEKNGGHFDRGTSGEIYDIQIPRLRKLRSE